MNCPRCDGLTARDYTIDQQAGSSSGIHGWRCVNCGMISDDFICENQLTTVALRMPQRQGLPRCPDRAEEMLSLRRCVPRQGKDEETGTFSFSGLAWSVPW
jgi:hypothetical protein